MGINQQKGNKTKIRSFRSFKNWQCGRVF